MIDEEQVHDDYRGSHLRDDLDDDYVDVRVGDGRARRAVIFLGVVLAAIVLIAGGVGLWVQRQIDPPGSPGDEVLVLIPAGTSTAGIGEILEDEGVIASTFVWRNLYVRLRNIGPFDAGQYKFRLDSAMPDVIDVLEAGPLAPPFINLTVPEGLTVREIVARLADPERGVERFSAETIQSLLDSGKVRSKYQPAGQRSMEGFLFPDTYRVEEDDDEAEVLKRIVGQLDDTLDELDVTARARALGLTPYEVVIVASLIEEETKVDGERAKVARVIYNRLSQGIPLGIDATSRYEAELAGRSRDDIDFTSNSPYNTRRVAGLPPTPIASPGRASIEAALSPVAGPWIFYVLADEAGNHVFTESAAEFERAKAECKRKGLGCG